MRSTGDILKCAYRYFLGGTISSVLKVGLGGICFSVEGASGMVTGSCLGTCKECTQCR